MTTWNDWSEERAVARAQRLNPDPGIVGYQGPPCVTLMGYRGPYPVKDERVTVRLLPTAADSVALIRRARREGRVASEVAKEFDAFKAFQRWR